MAVSGRKILRFADSQTKISCCTCGMEFSVPASWNRARLDDHETFFCPDGHKQSYAGESEVDRLRTELSAAKEETKTLKRRISGGVCPCCNRTFQNLKAHMSGQHSEFAK